MRSTFTALLVVANLTALAFASAAAAQPANQCVFTVSMTSGIDVNNLDFIVNYTNAGGNVGGEIAHPECTRALPGQVFTGLRDDDAGHLRAAIIRLSYFSGPVPLFGCQFLYDSEPPIAAQFSVQLTNAGRDGFDNNVDPLPTVAVTKVECPGELPEVTTTTTLPEPTTTTLPTGSGECGFPVSSGTQPSTSDALFALKAAVGVEVCALCVCDINNSGSVNVSDALGILQAAVGFGVDLNCPAC